MEEDHKYSSDGGDVPSDFFDEFSKEEFIEGLSVIDSWHPSDNKPGSSRSRINAEAIDSVQDLRELIGEDKKYYDKYEANHYSYKDRSCSSSRLDEYIKPGSRRDPYKTNEAIKKDKEVKVKEYLAKHLESSEVRPPGTELDEFYDDHAEDEFDKRSKYKKRSSAVKGRFMESPTREPKERRMSPSYRFRWESPNRRRMSPQRYRRPHYSPQRHHYNDTRHNLRRSPHRPYHQSHGKVKRYNKYSPHKHSPEYNQEHKSRLPYKHSQKRSQSPNSFREYHHSRSRSYDRSERKEYRRSQSKSSSYNITKSDIHYQSDPYPQPKGEMIYQAEPYPQYLRPGTEYSGNVQGYPYSQAPAYSGYVAYEYGAAPVMPQPVPPPNFSVLPPEQPQLSVPTMVPAPVQIVSPISNILPTSLKDGNQKDALAQLVADGKLSHEDYLKLAPYKGGSQIGDNNFKEGVLRRCNSAISQLDSMVLPNRLIINNELFGQEVKQIAPKFCSPLKRQEPPEFKFSNINTSVTTQQNKKIVESIISTLSLEKIMGITKKKVKKISKDVSVQTSKPFCDMCAIRESTKFCSVGTSVDREQLTATVHTQVVDQDLVSSKSVFNPSGSGTDGATISIAHMTPAQLVSQLAARAKTLKQAEPPGSNQYRRSNYDQDTRAQYRHGYNYHY